MNVFVNVFFVSDDRIISEGSMLNMTRLSRHDAGVYTCEAVNSQGAAVINVTVSVHCEYNLSGSNVIHCTTDNKNYVHIYTTEYIILN